MGSFQCLHPNIQFPLPKKKMIANISDGFFSCFRIFYMFNYEKFNGQFVTTWKILRLDIYIYLLRRNPFKSFFSTLFVVVHFESRLNLLRKLATAPNNINNQQKPNWMRHTQGQHTQKKNCIRIDRIKMQEKWSKWICNRFLLFVVFGHKINLVRRDFKWPSAMRIHDTSMLYINAVAAVTLWYNIYT